jgi:substrate import-associated zinc metallohydrolase lipoprotein
MKSLFKILLAAAIGMATFSFVGCSDEEFTPTIFDTREYPLDKSVYSFPLDTFLKVNFLEPYNLKFLYKMQDIGSDMQKNLVPCEYEKSIDIAVLSKYLWYDVYDKCAGKTFLKLYSPRIIHVIGSPALNPSSGTETLGQAEGGLKITLYNANNLSPNDIETLNEKFFKTMHHEFSHILHQNKEYPTDFRLISNGLYNAISWQDTADSLAVAQGFVSDYASSQAREDWVEVIANYIVKDSITWANMLSAAQYDWERVSVEMSTFNPLDQRCKAGLANRDSVGYIDRKNPTASNTQYNIQRKIIQRDTLDLPLRNAEGVGQIIFSDNTDGIDGKQVILQKLEMARQWLKEKFDLDLDELRREVQTRQWLTDAKGNFVFDKNGNYINRLTHPLDDGSGRTLIEALREEVNKYIVLQN